MFRIVAVVACVIGLAACGDPYANNNTPCDGARLADPRVGAWSVDVEVSAAGVFNQYQSRILVAAGGGSLYAHHLCPNGTGDLEVSAERDAQWSGDVACPFPTPGCENATLRIRDGSLWVENGSELVAAFNGTLVGCGAESQMLIRYRGRK